MDECSAPVLHEKDKNGIKEALSEWLCPAFEGHSCYQRHVQA